MNGTSGKEYLKDYFQKTDGLFEDFLRKKITQAENISKIPAQMLNRFLKTARLGKKIRGSLVVLGYKAAGGKNEETIIDASLFIELFHAGVLVHDDIMDEDDIRRGLPSLHKQFEDIGRAIGVNCTPFQYGNSMAICVGDAAFYLSWEKLLESSFPSEYLIRAGKIYSEYILKVVYGQALDVTTTNIQSLTEEDVLKIYKYKTAEYTGLLPFLIGATLAGLKDEEKIFAIKEYGVAFGWAFQIQDDILGLYGNEEELGKPIGSDLREGKNTLFMLHLSKHGTDEQKAFQRRVLGNRQITKDEVVKMRQILKDSGSYQYVIDLGWKNVAEGKKTIAKITTDKNIQHLLASLITYMMERTL